MVDAARECGLLINSPRPHLLRFMPALNVSLDDIDEAMSRLDHVIADSVTQALYANE